MITPLHAAIFLLASCTSASLAALVTLGDENPRLEWTPAQILDSSVCKGRPDNEICTDAWWQESADYYQNRTVRLTWGPSTSVRFGFRGSLFTVYGSTLTSGASASVRVDQEPPFFFTTEPSEGEEAKNQAQLYSRSGLDPNTVHDVVISYGTTSNEQTAPNNRRWLVIDSIIIDEVAESTVTTTTPTSDPTSPVSASTGAKLSADKSEGLSAAASAGIGVGVGVLAAGIILLLLLLRHRRQRQRIDLDAPPVSYPAPTFISGTTSVSQSQWAGAWQPESLVPSSVSPPSAVTGFAVREDPMTMPPAYTAVGRTKN